MGSASEIGAELSTKSKVIIVGQIEVTMITAIRGVIFVWAQEKQKLNAHKNV